MASKQSRPVVTRTSTCLCQSIRVEFSGEDKGAVLCHCSNCKQSGGSAFQHNHRFTKTKINIVKGEELLKAYTDANTKSGNTLYRHFCSNCGSPLWLGNSAIKGFAAVQASSMEGDKAQPFMELFGENKYPWIGEVTSKKAKL